MDTPAIAGLWVSGGREYRDELLRFIIDAEATAATDAFFRDLKERLKERFRQVEIWITAYPIRLL